MRQKEEKVALLVQTILAFAAGFLLNLTPCVLPAIPLKVRAILNEIGTDFRQRLFAAAAFRVDLTESDPGKEALLESYGGAGLPFAVILSPPGEVVARLPDLFSSSALEAAILRAGVANKEGHPDAGLSAESPNGEGRKGTTMNRPEKWIPEGKNRLALETSPYLLKHADNPVDWYPWGKEAFDKAKAEDKPIFLSIGYSTCYWCSVMERESFADASVAALMNRHVVSIKVDREERPDLDGIYMTAVQLMTGQGGWPMSVLLTPDRKPFFGATYIPRRQFTQLLEGVHVAWTQRREEVLAQAGKIAEAVAATGEMPDKPSSSLPKADLVRSAALRYGEMFDPEHGGFGGAPKFPQPAVLELLMSHFEMTGERSGMTMVERTLDAMARGGIHDQAGGGFHRYSTDAEWLVPHFEKMLYDQAQFLHAYARAFKLTRNEEFRRVSGEIAAYVRREMTSPTGLFYSAQDSEVNGEEGKSYLWRKEELKRVLGEKEYALASRAYGFSGLPNFEGRYILHLPKSHEEVARTEGMPVDDMLRKMDAVRATLLAERRKRPQPALDDKSIASWNGLMIEALAYAGGVFPNDEYVRMASKAADDLLKTLRNKDGELLHVARGGKAKLDAYLDDYAALILGLLELYRDTGEKHWLQEADRIGNAMVERLWEPGGGFRYAVPTVAFLIANPRDTYDGAFPSGNSLAVRALTGLAANGYPRYARYAAETFAVFEPVARKAPVALPYMLWGLHEYRVAKLPEESPPPPVSRLPLTSEVVRIEGSLSRTELTPGTPVDLTIEIRIDRGWHINANPASLPSLVPTAIEVEIEGGEVKSTPRYPEGKIFLIGEAKDRVSIYDGRVTLHAMLIPLRLPSGKTEGHIAVSVRAQACNDTGRCLAPSTLRTAIPFRNPRHL
ncbi:MAG: thioredoxin [Deltaproteobacteria bacterium CG_4_9_14_3_um_filter_65_9]|nr:MAG: thioredoxin [Deltaproteobacteria bacterium CG_4_9_14_3_um_filter_65_9]